RGRGAEAGGDTRVVCPVADGEPTGPSGSIGISGSGEAPWITGDSTRGAPNPYAVGFGYLNATNATALEPVAWSPGETSGTFTTAAADDNVFVIDDTDFTNLGATLSATVPSSVTGNVTSGTVSSGTGGLDHFGADGGRILS